MEYLMKHYTYLWEYSRPDQEFLVSNYFFDLAVIFKSYSPVNESFRYHFLMSTIEAEFTFHPNVLQLY